MKIAVLGTGVVGSSIASKLVSLGHGVTMGARSAASEKASAWAQKAGASAAHADFSAAAAAGEIVFNCTLGTAALDALKAAGEENLGSKIIIDVSNPLDFSRGRPPSLLFPGNDSLGERIQRAFPRARVVKTLNTINAQIMVDPGRVPGSHDVFMSGNDPGAKTTESLWWLTDAGARFGVDDTREVREALGLKIAPSPAPWVALRLLPQGPTLSRADALVEHDTLPMDMSPAELAVPK